METDLVQLAKKTIKKYLEEGSIYTPSEVPEEWKENKACFVTINKNGELRGCIGTLQPVDKLYKSIIQNSIKAAFEDPRFPPLKKEEFQDIDIEVSVLGEPHKIQYSNEEDLKEKIKNKGVILSKGPNSATFLPQVWEQVKDEEEFLNHLCMKAGLPIDEWKRDVEIEVYEVKKYN